MSSNSDSEKKRPAASNKNADDDSNKRQKTGAVADGIFYKAILSLMESEAGNKVDGTLLKQALLEGITENQIRDAARGMRKEIDKKKGEDQRTRSMDIDDLFPSKDKLGTIEKRRDASRDNEKQLKSLINHNELKMMKCKLSDYHDKSKHETVPIPAIKDISEGMLNNTDLPTMMAISAGYDDHSGRESISYGGPLYHANCSPAHATINNDNTITLAPIEFTVKVLGGQKPFNNGNFTNRTNELNMEIDQLWAAGQDLDKPPVDRDRDLTALQGSQLNIESLPSVEEIIDRVGESRFSKHYAEPALRNRKERAGITYLKGLHSVPVISPGNMVSSKFIGTKPHFGDKKLDQSKKRGKPNRIMKKIKYDSSSMEQRVAETVKALKKAMDDMKNTKPGHRYEEGMQQYFVCITFVER